jgi:hypothetical protein
MDVTPPFGTCSPGGALTGDNLRTQKTCVPTGAGVRSFASGRIPKRGGVGKLGGWKSARAGLSAWCGDSPAQSFATLVDFDSTNGANPWFMSFVQDTDGTFTAQRPEDVLTPGARSSRLRPWAH